METNNENTNENEEVQIEDPKAVLGALDRAKNDAKRFREEKEALENALKEKDGKINDFSSKLLKEKIAKSLAENGVDNAERVIKLFDMDQIAFDDELNVVGLDSQLEKLKEDLPEIFDAKLRVGGKADAAVSASVSTRYSASEMQAAKILGKL